MYLKHDKAYVCIYMCIYLAAGNTQYNWGALWDIGIVFVVCYIVLQCLGHASIQYIMVIHKSETCIYI